MSKALKDVFDGVWLELMVSVLKNQLKDFDTVFFQQSVLTAEWSSIALKQRIRHVTHCLSAVLPVQYLEALPVLESIAQPFRGLPHLVFTDFIECYGLAYPAESLAALQRLTQGSSAEFAVRPFVENNQSEVLELMLQWAEHPNEHVRRLASEGCRPRLPWGRALEALKKDPQPLYVILQALKNDESLYVRKSVANNLNDITKDHPEWVLDLCEQEYGVSQKTDWIIRHGLRSLLKQGNVRALTLIGYPNPRKVTVKHFSVDAKVLLGEKLCFSAELDLQSLIDQKLRLEYAIYFVRKQLKPYRKVFKVSSFIVSNDIKVFSKHHDFKAISTRKYTKGTHQIELIVNGLIMAKTQFEVLDSATVDLGDASGAEPINNELKELQ